MGTNDIQSLFTCLCSCSHNVTTQPSEVSSCTNDFIVTFSPLGNETFIPISLLILTNAVQGENCALNTSVNVLQREIML